MQKKLAALWFTMSIVLMLELLGVAWALLVNFLQVFDLLKIEQQAAEVIPLQISIVLMLLLSGLWLAITLRGAFLKKDWVRSSNLTIQVLVLAAATGILQGIIGTKPLGFALLICGIVGALMSILIAGFKKEA